jgi:hypothetical protein
VPTFVEVTKQAYHGLHTIDMLLIVMLPSLVFHHLFRTFLTTLLAVEQPTTVELARKNLTAMLVVWGQDFQLPMLLTPLTIQEMLQALTLLG